MRQNLLSRFRKETLKTNIPFCESILHGKIGSMHNNPDRGLENYKKSKNPHPDVLAAYPLYIQNYQLNFDVLETAKRKLSHPDYYSLLQALIWYRLQEDTRFMQWRDFYTETPPYYPPSYWLFVLPRLFNDCALRTPFGASYVLPDAIPDSLYMHHEIVGYPKFKALIEGSDPRFYGDVDKICGICYEALSTYIPTGGIIKNIEEYYQPHGLRPLEYDLVYPYCKGGLSIGWGSGNLWSQFWVNETDDIVCVNLYIGPTKLGELNVFVLSCPHEYAKETLEFYRKLHKGTEGSVYNTKIPDYENFKIYPIPPIDYKLSPEVIDYLNKIRPM